MLVGVGTDGATVNVAKQKGPKRSDAMSTSLVILFLVLCSPACNNEYLYI